VVHTILEYEDKYCIYFGFEFRRLLCLQKLNLFDLSDQFMDCFYAITYSLGSGLKSSKADAMSEEYHFSLEKPP